MNKAIAIIVVVLVFIFAGWKIYTKYQETHPKPPTITAPPDAPGMTGRPGVPAGQPDAPAAPAN